MTAVVRIGPYDSEYMYIAILFADAKDQVSVGTLPGQLAEFAAVRGVFKIHKCVLGLRLGSP